MWNTLSSLLPWLWKHMNVHKKNIYDEINEATTPNKSEEVLRKNYRYLYDY